MAREHCFVCRSTTFDNPEAVVIGGAVHRMCKKHQDEEFAKQSLLTPEVTSGAAIFEAIYERYRVLGAAD